ncbi:MAG: DUF1735 domain-containing protein [Chitinophagales bacterium]
MKKNNRSVNRGAKTSIIIWLLLILFGFTSCLKNSNHNIDFSTAGASVELPLAAANNNTVVSFSYTAVPSANIPFYINLASPHTLGTSVTATFAIDSVYLTDYNTANSTNYQLMPDSDYTVLNGWNRTIPAGQRLDSMYVKFDFTKMDATQTYVLPVTIKTASVPIEQWNHLMISPSVRNKYDGEYNLDIETDGWGAFGIADGPPSYPWGQVGTVTYGPSSVIFDILAQPVCLTGGGATGFGSTEPLLTFDPNTNLLVSVVNLAPDDGRGRKFQIDSAVTTSHWDPVTKNIYAVYLMFQNGRPTQHIYDTLIYQGSRP